MNTHADTFCGFHDLATAIGSVEFEVYAGCTSYGWRVTRANPDLKKLDSGDAFFKTSNTAYHTAKGAILERAEELARLEELAA